jgi:DNA-binding NarL/FixJ family response regulator
MNCQKKITILVSKRNFDEVISLVNHSSQSKVEFSVVIENEADLFEKVIHIKPDFVILDSLSGLELTKKIKSDFQFSTKCILCFDETDNNLIADLLQINADGYYLKNTPDQTLIDCIQKIMQGYRYFPPAVTKKSDASGSTKLMGLLSEREKEILRYISNNYSIKKIAEMLFISSKTVETHKNNIIRKLDLSGSRELRQIGYQLIAESPFYSIR